MTELNDGSEDSDGITPLRVSPDTVWNENVRNHQIGDLESGASPDVMADIGFKPPKGDLGSTALSVEVLTVEEAQKELNIVEPTIETIRKWVDESEVITASDGSRWLCATDEDGNRFAVVPATEKIGKDVASLHRKIDNMLSDLYDKKANSTDS